MLDKSFARGGRPGREGGRAGRAGRREENESVASMRQDMESEQQVGKAMLYRTNYSSYASCLKSCAGYTVYGGGRGRRHDDVHGHVHL